MRQFSSQFGADGAALDVDDVVTDQLAHAADVAAHVHLQQGGHVVCLEDLAGGQQLGVGAVVVHGDVESIVVGHGDAVGPGQVLDAAAGRVGDVHLVVHACEHIVVVGADVGVEGDGQIAGPEGVVVGRGPLHELFELRAGHAQLVERVVELIDPDNPIKIFNEAKIYGLAGNRDKESELLKKLDSVFPKYFISHFKFTDMYEERDLLETCFLLELRIFDKQCCFDYPMCILEGYKAYMEGYIIDAKEAFERAIKINKEKPEAYVLLAQTLQLMSGYDNPAYKQDAEYNYKKAMAIYQRENLTAKTEKMKRQLRHLNSNLSF